MGRTIAARSLAFLLVGAVPALLAVPVKACDPVGGELPGINCFAITGLAGLVCCLFGCVLGVAVVAASRLAGGRSAAIALAGIACGGLVVLELFSPRRDWMPGGSFRPWVVIAPLAAFGTGWVVTTIARRRAHRGAGSAGS